MKYGDKIIYMEGVIVAFDDCSISMDLKGRLGFLKIPRRMFITDYPVKIGQEVGFNMSFIEALGPDANLKYVSNLQTKEKRQNEIKEENDKL